MGIKSAEVTVAIPFVRVDATQNPNLRVDRGADPAAAYFRAMVVAFASVRRIHPEFRLKLVSDLPPPQEYGGDLSSLGVEIHLVSFDHRPPQGFTRRFEASLYMLDAMANVDSEVTIFIDPDVLCVASLKPLLASAGRYPAAIAMKNYAPDHDINGLTRRQAGELHSLLGEPTCVPDHFGGEVYVVPREQLRSIVRRSEDAWTLALARHAEQQYKFTTEEHILSFALRGTGVRDLSDHAARIWTARTYRNVNGAERKLSLWHLPAEKDRGFSVLYATYKAGEWPAHPVEFMNFAAREMGIYNRRFSRIAIDALAQVAKGVLNVVQRFKPRS